MKKPRNYYSYLLRLWRENDAAPWRASLEDAHTGERRNFARLQDLFRVLDDETQTGKERAVNHEDHVGH
jgi:hypothetical protein